MDHHFAYSKQNKPGKVNTIILALFALTIGVVSLSFSFLSFAPKRLEIFELEEQEFESYIKKYNKQYETKTEYHHRFLIYRDNSAYIRLSNTLNRD
jgi:Cathepsin propeptide inhibitor domain (I29).